MLTAGRKTVRKPKNTQAVEDLDDQSIDDISNPDRIKWDINSPSPHGFFLAQLQRTLDISLPWLTAIFHGCLVLNHIPTRWLGVEVIFIPIAGKPSHTNTKDFRPISLCFFLLKTLERLIDIHIRLTISDNEAKGYVITPFPNMIGYVPLR